MLDALDNEFREQLAHRIASYTRRRGALISHRAELDAEIKDVETRLRSAEQLFEAEFGQPTLEEAAGSQEARRIAPPAGPLTGMHWGDALVRVLDEHGPLHVKEIWRVLQEGGFTTDARDPLRSIVAMALREPSVFRVAPNTYALNGAKPEVSQEGGGA